MTLRLTLNDPAALLILLFLYLQLIQDIPEINAENYYWNSNAINIDPLKVIFLSMWFIWFAHLNNFYQYYLCFTGMIPSSWI